MTIGYNGTLPADLWNPPPPSIQVVRHLLIQALDKALAGISIQQQTVIVAVRWDVDGWLVHLQEASPSEPYDGWIRCQIDFDQYPGTVQEVRRSTAEDLAAEVLEQAVPDWRSIQRYGPDWDANPDLN